MNYKDLFPNKETTELLNTLTYDGYGSLYCSKSIDLSVNDRLAICTDKSILILNPNYEWPSIINNTTPFKFFLNTKTASNNCSNANSKQPVQFDTWVQDLQENKSEQFYLNIIRNVSNSENFTKLFNSFFKIDEYLAATKKNPFHKHIQDMIQNNVINQSNKKLSKLNTSQLENNSFELSNSEDLKIHKKLHIQTNLFDPVFYEYLNYLNPTSSGGQIQDVDLNYSFKHCKWNLNPKLNLLLALTRFNQILIFDCTRLRSNNTVNILTTQKDDDLISSKNDYIKTFDLKTKSKMINLTEYLISNKYKNFLNQKFKTFNEFITSLNHLIPTCFSWGPKVNSQHLIEFELLFIAFKSNEIGVFKLTFNDNEIQIDLIELNEITLSLLNDDEEDDDELINLDLAKNYSSFEITEIKLFDTFLLAALSNGKLLMKNFNFESPSNTDWSILKIDELKNEFIKRIECINLPNLDSNYLLLIQLESKIFILIFEYKNNKFERKNSKTYESSEKDINLNLNNDSINYLTKTNFKLIDFKLLNDLNLLVIFENSMIDLVHLKLDHNLNIHIENRLINNTTEIKFDSLVKLESSNTYLKQTSNLFKSTKQILISSNSYLLYQINDFSKSSLIQKRPPNFQFNIYRLKQINQEEIDKFLNQYLETESVIQSDFIWLFKHDLYLKNKQLFSNIYEYIYDNMKNFKHKSNKIVYLKRLRILTYFIWKYFETVGHFDSFNSKLNLNQPEEVDSDDNESDYRDDDEMENGQSSDLKIKDEVIEIEEQSNIVKSTSYYKAIFRELSLSIFKHHSFNLILKSYEIGFDKLTSKEKLILVIMSEFFINKNFLNDLNEFFTNISSKTKKNDLEKWLKKLNERINTDQNLLKLIENLNCDLCGKKFRMMQSLDLEKIKCESGHLMARCEKTLLPLNNFKYKKCDLCNSRWNSIRNKKEFVNFSNSLIMNQNKCLFCD